jgi:tetratricopeptide (TPR) repeat protein
LAIQMSEIGVDKSAALRILAHGLRGEPGTFRSELGLSEKASDRDVARMTVRLASAEVLAALDVPARHTKDPRPPRVARSSRTGDASLLGRLEIDATAELAALEDPRTLMLTLRGGSLHLRRATVDRLTKIFAEGRISSEHVVQIESELASLRDGSLEYELRRALAAFRGTESRRVMDEESGTFDRVVSELSGAIAAFWQGERATEPVTELSAEHRAMLLLRLRDAPDAVARHISAVIEGDDGVASAETRRGLLESLRHCADRRIVPSLIAVVEAGGPEVALPAARVLGRMEDARATSALRSAFHRTVVESHRAVMAGALGFAGDPLGAEFVRSVFRASVDQKARLAALEALEALGSPDDALRVAEAFETFSPRDLVHAVYVTGRIGDSRVLSLLDDLETAVTEPAVRVELEEARKAILARLELRGELPASYAVVEVDIEPEAIAQKPPIVRQFVGFRHYLVGMIFMALGLRDRAIGRFSAATEVLTWWAIPLISIGAIYAKQHDYGQALSAYRRALEREPGRVQANVITMRLLSRCFLRRAEQLTKEGRRDIAAGLVAEANRLDLRKAPAVIRFELARLERALKRGEP